MNRIAAMTILAIVLMCSIACAGNVTLDYHYTTEMTDAAATVTRIVECDDLKDVTVYVTTDKGSTVVITPIILKTDNTVLGPPSTTLTIADGGETVEARYSAIGSPKVKVVVTKTEAGTTSGFTLDIRGLKL